MGARLLLTAAAQALSVDRVSIAANDSNAGIFETSTPRSPNAAVMLKLSASITELVSAACARVRPPTAHNPPMRVERCMIQKICKQAVQRKHLRKEKKTRNPSGGNLLSFNFLGV